MSLCLHRYLTACHAGCKVILSNLFLAPWIYSLTAATVSHSRLICVQAAAVWGISQMPPENPRTHTTYGTVWTQCRACDNPQTVCSWCPMWRRKGSSCQSYVISEAPLDTAGLLERVVSLWKRQEPCFGVAKTGTDFIHAHCLTSLQQGCLASSIRADAELPWV